MSLLQSFKNFEKRFNDVNFMEHMKDSEGMYAVRFSNKKTGLQAFFCFKNSMKGKIVSVHLSLYQEAKKWCMPIFLGLGPKYFYMFTANDIDRECFINQRENGVQMMNFPITAGRSLQKKDAKKQAEKQEEAPPKELEDFGLEKIA